MDGRWTVYGECVSARALNSFQVTFPSMKVQLGASSDMLSYAVLASTGQSAGSNLEQINVIRHSYSLKGLSFAVVTSTSSSNIRKYLSCLHRIEPPTLSPEVFLLLKYSPWFSFGRVPWLMHSQRAKTLELGTAHQLGTSSRTKYSSQENKENSWLVNTFFD